jgi:secreted trypsin-like serine protease
MTTPRRLLLALVAVTALVAAAASPASAVVGGQNATAGEYPAVAQITFGKNFLCTGTLIAPDTVLTAGHCSSITANANVASPAAYPPALIDVRIGNHEYGRGGELVPVSRVIMQPNYFLTDGYDISLIKLSRASTKTPVKVAGSAETSTWSAGTLETIVGWGRTRENGQTPDILQEAQVPVTTHAYCDNAYDGGIDEATMLCAGYPEGGVDTCQGDSGGPMFGRTSTGAWRVVGATSFGVGCAREGIPGVYARVGDTTLREWIRSHTPGGVA